MVTDKLNQVDYCWHIVRTQPRKERRLAELLERHREETKNILEVYCPTRTTVNVHCGGSSRPVPLFMGMVFVLSTQQALADFIQRSYPEGIVLHDRKEEGKPVSRLWTIPEDQMRAFRDYNENYADKVVVLERPFSDYAVNKDLPNEIVRVIDGPLAGYEGYICRIFRKKGLVFEVCGAEPGSRLTVAFPDASALHVVRLHNAESDRLQEITRKEQAADFLLSLLQDCGYEEQTIPLFRDVILRLSRHGSVVRLCEELSQDGHGSLACRLLKMTGEQAGHLLTLARYAGDDPQFPDTSFTRFVIRPFLTASSEAFGTSPQERVVERKFYTELIRPVGISEEVYYPSQGRGETRNTLYEAHIGILPIVEGEKENKGYTLFANWDYFLGQYFLTGGAAQDKLVHGRVQPGLTDEQIRLNREKAVASFRTCIPTLYKVLTDPGSRVRPVQDLLVGGQTLNALAIVRATDLETAKTELVETCLDICREANTCSPVRIGNWRRYLRTVWLHV